MGSEEVFEQSATVIERMPRSLFRLRCEDGDIIEASLMLSRSHSFGRVIPGDKVKIERYRKDPHRARIIGV